ncbi:unnamed protein product, partial [Larinioides sclopetarius]
NNSFKVFSCLKRILQTLRRQKELSGKKLQFSGVFRTLRKKAKFRSFSGISGGVRIAEILMIHYLRRSIV